MGVHGSRAQVLLNFLELLKVPETNHRDIVGLIHNGCVMAWSYMNGVPYSLTPEGVLMPQFAPGNWEVIADDAMDAMVALLEVVATNGGPDVPEALRRPVGEEGCGSRRGWGGRPVPGRAGGWGCRGSAGNPWWRGTR